MKIIYGTTDFAEKLYYLLKVSGVEVDAFTVDRKYMTVETIEGIRVIPYEELKKKASGTEIYLAIGYRNMNRNRENLYNEVKKDGFSVASYIHPTAVVSTDCLGEGNLIFEHVVIGPYAKLGNCNICYPKSFIAHHTEVGNFNFFAISSSVAGNVTVKDRCFLGNNSYTKDGIVIADETLAGAGAYVSSDTRTGDCVVPARSIVLEKKSIELM